MINFKQLLLADKDKSQEFGCLMALVNKKDCIPIINFNKKLIKDEDLYHEINKNGKDEYGRELECHITIKFGFIRDLNELEIRQLLKGQKSFVVELYELSKFDSDPNFDVIILKARSPMLNRLNQLSSIYPTQDTHPNYQPHLTLGYVKKGLFPNLQKEINFQILIDKVYYSPIQGDKSYFTLEEDVNTDIETEIQKLEGEWDRLDSVGNQSVAQHHIAEKIVALRAKQTRQKLSAEKLKREKESQKYTSPKSQELWGKLKASLTENKILQLVGNCGEGEFDAVAKDTTDLAQLVENSKEITLDEFKKLTGLTYFNDMKFGGEYGYNEDRNVAWCYNEDNGIHYFFA